MRIAIDVDGVLACFEQRFAALLTHVSGKSCPTTEPPVWDWPQAYGYSTQEVLAAWEMTEHYRFWQNLPAYPDTHKVDWESAERQHDLYFVTARHALPTVKQQTENWLTMNLGLTVPTVLLSVQKARICKALDINVFIDDRPDLCEAVKRARGADTEVYLRARRYNESEHARLHDGLGIHIAHEIGDIFHGFPDLRQSVSGSSAARAGHPNQ